MGSDPFIQHGLTTNQQPAAWSGSSATTLSWKAVRRRELPRRPAPIHIDATFVPLRPGLIINNPQRHRKPEEQRAIFEANDWQIVDSRQPAH